MIILQQQKNAFKLDKRNKTRGSPVNSYNLCSIKSTFSEKCYIHFTQVNVSQWGDMSVHELLLQ